MNRDEIRDLYTLYGFELDNETEDAIVFTYTNGYFNNAEIVFTCSTINDKYKSDYEKLGYSVSTVNSTEIQTIHQKLFSGFFNITALKYKCKKVYNDYCLKQEKKLLGNKYEYINCEYIINNDICESGLINTVYELLNSEGSHMVILEAAAGYGKTCTAYEVFNMIAESKMGKAPLMTELSRNRKASIFRYVLLDEMDRQFPSLSSSVVKYEIGNGNVVLIIDGFDELLSKSVYSEENDEDSFEEVQGMLDTIAVLLSEGKQTKILITSRKSAVFTGEQFSQWISKRNLFSNVTRIELRPPRVKDWIGQEKYNILKSKIDKVEYISNPVLLSLLKCHNEDYISKCSLSDVINDYFTSLLERERVRQSLYLSKDEQLKIMRRLASYFVEFNISSEDSDFIKMIILEIISPNIDEYLSRYTNEFQTDIETIPDEDEFAMKLVHHALLDRVISSKNKIGFINDFFFGILLGYALINNEIDTNKFIDYMFIDLIATAYTINDMENRDTIVGIVKKILSNYSSDQQLELSIKLFHENVLPYNDKYFSNLFFGCDFKFSKTDSFKNCVFSNCIFQNCYISHNSFIECQFYNCMFYDVVCEEINHNKNINTLIFLGCVGFESIVKMYDNHDDDNEENDIINYEKVLLEQFWKVGYSTPEPRRSFTAIYKGITNKNTSKIDEAIEELTKKGLIVKRNYCYELNFSKIKEIKEILGRN